ncbi:MAG: S9 family peptidase, partial [Candidatus Eremiobacteraeota bacterium]|nr:S9 family peptidase [Candidatus Eremiobacteraeota bacterium]
MRTMRAFAALAGVLALVAASPASDANRLAYPPAPRGTVTDDYFGTAVADPYRWLEDVDSTQTVAWVTAEGGLTRQYLDAIPQRSAIKTAYAKLINYERLSAPFRAGSHWFWQRNSGLQNQSVLYMADSPSSSARVFLDPNTLSADGTIALAGTSFTTDGKYMAYGTQASGSDWTTWHVRSVASGRDISDVIQWSKYSGATWVGDRGFYYTGYDKPTASNTTLVALGVEKLWFHVLGTPQSADRLIYASSAHPDEFLGTDITEDERFVFFERAKGFGNSLAWRRPTDPPAAFKPIYDLDPNVSFGILGNDNTRIYVLTNKDAPRFRIAWFDLADPAHTLHGLVPQTADKLENASLIGDKFYLQYLHDAHALVAVADMHGRSAGSVELPGIGSGGLPTARRTDRTAFYGFTSFTYPTTIYQYDTRSQTSTIWAKPKIAFDPSHYTTDLIFATSKDGTKVPVFVTHRSDMVYDGST